MAIDFMLPDLGENIESAEIGQVLVKEGDVIAAEQVILELETDKAVFELPCPHAGKIVQLHVKSGDAVKVGAKILTIDAEAGAAKAEEPAKPKDEAPAEKKEEPAPKKEEPAAAAPASHPSAPASRPVPPVDTSPAGKDRPPAPAGPATRRLARELGVDLYEVSGSGPGGRITADDVKAYVKNRSQMGGGGGSGPAMAGPLPDFSQFGPVERQSMSKLARTAANNLTLAWQVVPHVTQHELADITATEDARRKFVKSAGDKAPKITMTVIAIKAVVAALKVFPHFNASCDMRSGEVIFKKYYNIGIAVDTPNGLVVPVVKDADKKSLRQLASEMTELANKARDRKLTMADMQGGTFTISNLGGIGGVGFTPIVNYPEVAILGLSRSRQQQVLVDGKAEWRLMMPLSLSYDHRVVNGADGARFAGLLASLLADPFQLMVDC